MIVAMMPTVGYLVSRIDARYLIATGFLVLAVSFIHMTNLILEIDFTTLVIWRACQVAGAAFLFVPINTIAYTDMPPDATNQVSALVNLMRNMGGSIGISAATTVLERRQQVHQGYQVVQQQASVPAYIDVLQMLATISLVGIILLFFAKKE